MESLVDKSAIVNLDALGMEDGHAHNLRDGEQGKCWLTVIFRLMGHGYFWFMVHD